MPLVLSDKAQEMLADLPPYLQGDPSYQAIIAGYAGEFQRIEDAATAIIAAIFPAQADDLVLANGVKASLLSMWETLLTLPVAPAGVSVAERRSKVTANIQRLQSGRGADWVAILSQAFSGFSWGYEEGPGDYQVTIFMTYGSSSYTAGQVIALARKITPAHLEVSATYDQGFLLDISDMDTDAIL